MTLDEARCCAELALWSGGEDEFLLNPESGIVWWRPIRAQEGLHGDSWRPVPWGKTVPSDRWSHSLGCGCPLCR
jgi:hypothetical protein